MNFFTGVTVNNYSLPQHSPLLIYWEINTPQSFFPRKKVLPGVLFPRDINTPSGNKYSPFHKVYANRSDQIQVGIFSKVKDFFNF